MKLTIFLLNVCIPEVIWRFAGSEALIVPGQSFCFLRRPVLACRGMTVALYLYQMMQ